MKYLLELSSLIQIRNFLFNSLDNLSVQINNNQAKDIGKKISALDEVIIEKSLKIDINLTSLNDEVFMKEWKSTSNVEEVWKQVVSETNDKPDNKKRKNNKLADKTNEISK